MLDLLHVRLPLRHPGAPQGRQGPLHPGQPAPPGEPRRAVRQGLRRHHAAHFAGAAVEAAAAVGERGSGEFEEIEWDEALEMAAARLARGASAPPIRASSRSSPAATRARRSPAGGRPSSARRTMPPTAASARSTWPRRHLHHRRLVLGVRRAGLGAYPLFPHVRRGGGPRQQPDQDRARPHQVARREVRVGQSGADRLFGHRRRMGRHRRAPTGCSSPR
jgi:hypothetical protein